MRSERGRKDEGGFTLLEVMAALAIFGVGVLAAIQLFSGGLRLAAASRAQSDLVRAARERMALVLSSRTLAEGVSSGQEGGLGWTVEVAPFRKERPEPAGKRLMSVKVYIKELGREGRGYSVATLKTVYDE